MKKPFYQILAESVDYLKYNQASPSYDKVEKRLYSLVKKLPSGSGFNAGTQVDFEKSTKDKIVLMTSFHHMNDNGYYDEWTDHSIVIRPDWGGITIKVTGKNKNNIKEYIADVFHYVLTSTVTL